MINIAIAFIAGIAAFHFYSFFPFTVFTLTFGTILYLFFRCTDRKKMVLITMVFVAAFFYSMLRNNELPETLLPSEEVLIMGTISNVPEMKDDNLRFSIREGLIEGIAIHGKEVMIIDGGMQKPDMGRMVIAPFLWSKGIHNIVYLVLSHAHPDHYGGLRYVLDTFDVRELWTNGNTMTMDMSFLNISKNSKVRHRVLKRGDMLETENYDITVIHPYQSFYADSPRGIFSDENSSSLVLKVEAENVSILFTGDIEEEAEENLLFADEWLKSDIIKVPHHGGRTSSSSAFIQEVAPQVAVVSAGRNNPFHHPHKTTMHRYTNAGVEFFRTDKDGAVSINMKNGRYAISTYMDSKLIPVKTLKDELRNLKLLFSN